MFESPPAYSAFTRHGPTPATTREAPNGVK